MVTSRYVDCELFLSGRDQARLSVAGRDYSGRPILDAALERRLLEVDLEPVHYGTLLFQALFPDGDDLLAGYRESLTVARHEGKRLRLRLHVAVAAPPELHDLHWELLYDPVRKIALGRSQETAFSRYLGVSFEPGKAVAGRPRLLVVVSSPRDLADYDLPDTGGREALREALELALSPPAELMTLEFLDGPATVEHICDRLVAGEFHALHLTAHGLLPPDETTARLVLETGDGRAHFVEEELFAEVFAGQRSLRLVSLIACHGGAPAGRDPFSGLGPALVHRGVPAVLAMRRQISVAGATRFAEHFYRNLARSGRVDAAANEARLQLYLGESDSSEWGTPTLFMRLAEGRLWRSPSDAAEAADSEAADDGAGSQATTAVVKTLALSELVDRTRLAEELGDERMAEILSRHGRLVRDLLAEYEGREADDRAGGFLMLFERPIHAVGWALACHQAMAGLSRETGIELACRVAIHLGEVVLIETPPDDIARGAKPLEIEGLARPIAGRLMSLARGGQTLLSAAAFDLARRSSVGTAPQDTLRWMAHGEYLLAGAHAPIAVYEVGVEDSAPLQAPIDGQDARRAAGDQTILGWRPAVGLEVPQRPKWVLEKKLSEGGFGEVWLTGREKIKRQRVFKFCFEVERLKALQREITLFRLLKEELGDRDDIARILDWNFEQAPYFIESEYAADGNLMEWAEEQGGIAAVPMAQRLEIVAQLATALAAAHSVGVLHKDVKPTNVLIACGIDRLQVRLADFGIGTVTERDRLVASGITALGLTAKTEEEPSSYSGTRLYMAPELLEGKRATLQADIYALGVVLYQAVVGDFTRALAPGWRRDVDDELLCADIALAVDGSPERRLGNALRITERLRSLETRRREREAERREREQARQTLKALARSRKRRKVVAAVIGVLIVFSGVMAFQTNRIAKEVERANREAERANLEAERANREAEVARQVSQFTVDLFRGSEPSAGLAGVMTARELLDQGAEKIGEGLPQQPLTQAMLMDTIGTVYSQLGLYKSAQPLFEEALAIRQKHLGQRHPSVAASLREIATVYRLQGHIEQAESLFHDSLEILEKALGEVHPDLVPSLNGLGIIYWRQERYQEAEAAYRRSLKILELAETQDQAAVAKSLNNLGLVRAIQGRYADAEPLYLRAIQILESSEGPDGPTVAQTLTNLGNAYRSQQRYQEAERILQRTLEIRERIMDPDHPMIASSLNNLANLYRIQERLGDAEALFERALRIWEAALGQEHRSVGIALTNLADVYAAQERYLDAETLYHRSLGIFEKALGPEHIYVASPLHGLATIYRDQERAGEAEPLYRRALEIRRQKLVSEHQDLRATIAGYAALLRSMNREADAVELERRLDSPRKTE